MHMHDQIIERRFQATDRRKLRSGTPLAYSTDSRLIVNIDDKPLSVENVRMGAFPGS
jgi:hypothetical protein